MASIEQKIKKLVSDRRYEFSKHAEREREADQISIEELEVALFNCEVIEDYPFGSTGSKFSYSWLF